MLLLGSGADPFVMKVGINTDIAGKPVKSKNYTAELAQLIADTSGGVSTGQRRGSHHFVTTPLL